MKKPQGKYVSKKPDGSGYVVYDDVENATWATLTERQLPIVQTRACDEYLEGLEILKLPHDRVPQIPEVNACLQKLTGWSIAPVPALIGFDRFFRLCHCEKTSCVNN